MCRESIIFYFGGGAAFTYIGPVISKDDITNLIPGINLNNKSTEGNIYPVQKMLLKFHVDITPA